MKEKILNLFFKNKNEYLSGQAISEELGISRTAVWKYIKILKEEGYEFLSSSRKGYKLINTIDKLTYSEIEQYLNTEYLGRSFYHYEEINSTNNKAKELSENGALEGTVVIAEKQTNGKGRLGRQWISPLHEGIWMSIILRPNIDPLNIPKITHIGAAAIINALKELNIDAHVKWPNDVIINGKKICGILTEMSGEINKVNYVIMGIGINANISSFPAELKEKASSLFLELGHTINRQQLTALFLNNFEELYNDFIINKNIKTSIKIIKEKSLVLNRDLKLIINGTEKIVYGSDLTDEGVLIVKNSNGSFEEVISGEVSIRGLDSYI